MISEKIELEKKFEIDNKITISGWDSDYVIYKIINDNNYKIGVEIGVAYGSHSDNILKMTEVEKLYGIDPYMRYEEYEGDPMCLTQNQMDKIHDFVIERLSYYDGRFELFREESKKAVDMFKDNSLDFVYIDGNHFEDYIREDLYNWWSKIKVGGIISGHDYNHGNFPFVTGLVDNFCLEKKINLIYIGNHVWYAKKI